MKKIIQLVIIVLLLVVSDLVYAGQFGPPEPDAGHGKFSVGIGYFFNSNEVKISPDIDTAKGKINQNYTYLKLGYGFIKNWEIYTNIGGMDFQQDSDNFSFDMKSSFKPFGSIGIKGLLWGNSNFGIGPFIQAGFSSGFKDEKWSNDPDPDGDNAYLRNEVKNLWDVNLGISAQAKIEKIVFFGGAFVFKKRAELEHKADVYDYQGGTYVYHHSLGSYTVDIKERSNIGGFVGVKLPLIKRLNFEVEGQYNGKFSAGWLLTYSF
jgi:hypothetical protein